MAIRVGLHHVTRYLYDRPVTFSPHVVRLRPAAHSRTAVVAYSLKVTPEPHFVNWQQDPFGNYLARFVFPEPAKELRVEVDLVAELVTINPFDFFLEPYAEKYPFLYEERLERELGPYLQVAPTAGRFEALLQRVRAEFARPERRMVDVLVDVNRLIQSSLRYDIRMEPGVFSPDETLERGHGSCRDFAWLMVNLLRAMGLAARFVSGYSIQLRPDQKPLEGPAGVAEDCTDLHAWAEAYLPGAGWVGLDATSGLWCGEGHIPLACTAEPSNAAPIAGSFSWDQKDDDDDELGQDFQVEMKVTRLEDRPRPTRSYREDQWEAILAAGDAVERALAEGDVRLTMGGEPTFVSVDDMEGAEWNTAALGPTKGLLADDLLRRLRARFAPGSLLHHGQGKWYPGEQLPRWAYSCYWRQDGVPVWQNAALLADGRSQGHGPDEAGAFMRALVARLGIGGDHVLPGYEDVWYYLWRERRLPANVDPFDSKLDDEQERARLRRVFQQGLASVVGWALPLRHVERSSLDDGGGWQSGAWHLRDERLYLLPGDSPMGFRLPLDSLPWTAPELGEEERDPFAPRPPLPRILGQRISEASLINSPRDLVRTALCVEPRDGVLHVFMPPLYFLEHYLDLVAHLEATADALKMPVRIEGYPPPKDPRLLQFSVTPDPGVIEVNIHPARSWRDAVAHTTALYEEARAARLGTDKFMLDGRHTGTGGGNHVVLGGPTPNDSPLIRRPDLLRSFGAYFNNHPALSYLFSTLFVGPTSQAPRVDEARQDSVYDLELAFSALQSGGPPWLGDRLFRHLFTDVTGNTHRTAMCIDKLFSPDHAGGRQGLLELRMFEMPPDARMSLAQQLLIRSLVAWFWQKPYQRPLVRWGTALHDRFMLPHFCWQDMADIAGDLGLDAEWFRPHWEFRFPRYGSAAADGVALELRQAIEPWHVLGEEPGAGGTVRYVDSSVERVQLLVGGLIDRRHAVLCNGRPVPLHPTGRNGEYVAGVRYKAWKPPSSMHPTLEVDTPLVFDIVDTWSERAVGGCTYYVAHPGGRAYDVYPRNGLEAESRRMARFAPFGHTPGRIVAAAPHRSVELPFTLDLRRV
jgi:uncharacterized protein (DUF2126 family)/transglutaminase-like putative cysteine protease